MSKRNKLNIFIDLDGTILDVRKRHILLYQQLCEQLTINIISDKLYWDKKREKLLPNEIYVKGLQEKYTELFRNKCEDVDLLNLDVIYEGLYPLLQQYSKKYNLVVCTKRHSRKNLINQLEKLNIYKLFTQVINTNSSKVQAITQHGYTKDDWIIGDTEEDISTAKILVLKSIAVTWGLRSKNFLMKHKPNLCIDSVDDLVNRLDENHNI